MLTFKTAAIVIYILCTETLMIFGGLVLFLATGAMLTNVYTFNNIYTFILLCMQNKSVIS